MFGQSGGLRSGTGRSMARGAFGLLLIVFTMAVTVASAAAFNVTGVYNANYHCEAGWCAGSDFPAPGVHLEQARGSDVVIDPSGASGTLSGHVLTLHGGSSGSYEFDETITFSADGKTWSGPLSDSNGTSGTDTGVKISGPQESTVSGKIHDDRGSIAPGETVKLSGTSDEKEAISLTTTANPFGEYSFEVPAGNYAVTASGEMEEENGGSLAVAKKAGPPVAAGSIGSFAPDSGAPECEGEAKEATCTLSHLEEGKTETANFTYTYCTSKERLPNGKPPTRCPVIFIPGFLGSRLECASGEVWTNIPNPDFGDMGLLPDGKTNSGAAGSCSATIKPIPGLEGVVSTAAGADIYGAALAYLNKILPERAYAFTYDWRKSPVEALPALDEEVKSVLKATSAEHVILMAHSMGGLVTQAYISNPSYATNVIRAVTIGTPYWGAPKSHIALLTGKSGEPSFEAGLDQLIDLRSFNITESAMNNLQIAARTMQGLYWLYPSADYGHWLSIDGPGIRRGGRGGSEIDPWVTYLGGVSSLLDSAVSGHAALHGFHTNGVDYQIVVGTGVPTITDMEIHDDAAQVFPEMRVLFGSGDGTVPLKAATQGQAESPSPEVPIVPVCGIGHVGLPGAPSVQAGIEDFLLKGKAVGGAEHCGYHGVEVEIVKTKIAAGAKASATKPSPASQVTVTTASGATMTLAQAAQQELVQVLTFDGKVIIATDNHAPVTLKVSGSGTLLNITPISSTGKEGPGSVGKTSYYGPLNGTVALGESIPVTLDGKRLKPSHAIRPPHTIARITRHGHRFLVRLSIKGKARGVVTYTVIGKAKRSRYRKALLLTAKQLKKLSFASVDRYGDWEKLQKAHVPRR
jgi:pimeloyl-ACP methyl ester carboxylesterase